MNSVHGPTISRIGKCAIRAQVELCGRMPHGDAHKALEVDQHWTVSTGKTQCILLKGALSANRPPCVRLNGSSIQYSRVVEYLGVSIKERLSLEPHLKRLKVKMLGLLGGLRRVLGREWGLGRRATCIIYKGLFVSCMSYNAGVWFHTMR